MNRKDIIGYEGLYDINIDGEIRNKITLKILKHRKGVGKYLNINLHKNSIQKTYSIHRLKAIHFIDNPNNYPCVNHIDHDTYNNDLNNLEWTTIRENTTHTHLNKIKTSKFTGVYFSKKDNIWLSRIIINKELICIGSYHNELDAAIAYKEYFIKNKIINKYVIHI